MTQKERIALIEELWEETFALADQLEMWLGNTSTYKYRIDTEEVELSSLKLDSTRNLDLIATLKEVARDRSLRKSYGEQIELIKSSTAVLGYLRWRYRDYCDEIGTRLGMPSEYQQNHFGKIYDHLDGMLNILSQLWHELKHNLC